MVAEAQELMIGLSSSKGKRTKRQRPASPLGLSVSSSSGTTAGDPRIMTPSTSIDDNIGGGEEEEDMANCLMLLAQGFRQFKKFSEPSPTAVRAKPSTLESGVYRCKTCDRSFQSFQALGGHRASHMKPNNKLGNYEGNNKIKAEKLMEEYDRRILENTSTTLSLQISNSSNIKKSNNNKVHECSVCGAEFSSGQALGGHMRRHRAVVSSSTTTTSTLTATVAPASSSREDQSEFQESKKRPRNSLQLDLNLPAETEEEHLVRESKFHFKSKEQVLAFSANSLVDCHY